MEQAQLLLSRLKIAAETIGLHANCKKTEYMLINQDQTDLKTVKKVHDVKYLGLRIADSKKDMKGQIRLAWKALNKLDKARKSRLKRKLKVQFFISAVESFLLYGTESWSFTNKLCKMLDGTCTRM